jgi:hypothetical protein
MCCRIDRIPGARDAEEGGSVDVREFLAATNIPQLSRHATSSLSAEPEVSFGSLSLYFSYPMSLAVNWICTNAGDHKKLL